MRTGTIGRGERAGVVFTDRAEAVPLDLIRRLKICETANARLKARVRRRAEVG